MATTESLVSTSAGLPQPHRFSIDQFVRLIETGVLSANDHVELIEGVVCTMSPIGSAHEVCTNLTAAALRKRLPSGWHERIQQTVNLADSAVQPDIVIVRGAIREYVHAAPTPEAIGLIVEVADSSLLFDLGKKLRLYAQAGIQEYWVVNLIDRRVDVFGGASKDYSAGQTFAGDGRVPFTLGGQSCGEIAVAEILP